MTNILLLDTAILTVSVANIILMTWLGLTVLLNAQRRTWGAWVAGGGLVLGAVFFVSHTAILVLGRNISGQGLNFWWQLGWIPVGALPFVWYVVVLWYSGFWEFQNGALFLRQRQWFRLTALLAISLFLLFLFGNPLTTYKQVATLDFSPVLSVFDLPVIILLYPVYIVLCITLSLDALRRPGPTERVMGDLARRRARPWLIATSVVFLMVSLLVAWVMVLVVFWSEVSAGSGGIQNYLFSQARVIGIFDLLIASLIGIAVVLLGQAVVAYEIFTGKTLPRRGFLRHWRRAILLAMGYSLVVSIGIMMELQPFYILLFTAVIMTAFYALLSWRSYTERERYIDDLRPFVASQGLFDQLLTNPNNPSGRDGMRAPFYALCQDVLGARVAYLVALGPLAPLAGPPLAFPDQQPVPEFTGLGELMAQFESPAPVAVRVSELDYAGAAWLVPLWSERGQIGLLLLGEKRDGGLYTQEEIEIAQTSGERLIDTIASAEIARRLMALQRQRLAESQILDQRARRVLHDDVLQQLHAAMLKLVNEQSRPNGGTSEAIELLADVHNRISNLLREMPTTTLPEIARHGLIGALRQLLDEELGVAFESIKWEIDLDAERQVQMLSPLTAEVLYYAVREAIRNAARHGRRDEMQRPLHLVLRLNWVKDELCILVEDDGVGVSTERTVSSGHGLALHSTMMAVVGGELAVESEPGEFTRVSLSLPQSA